MQEPLTWGRASTFPKFSFSMKANLPQNGPKWLARWTKENLYRRMPTASCFSRLVMTRYVGSLTPFNCLMFTAYNFCFRWSMCT